MGLHLHESPQKLLLVIFITVLSTLTFHLLKKQKNRKGLKISFILDERKSWLRWEYAGLGSVFPSDSLSFAFGNV